MSRRLLRRPTSGPRRASTSCESSRPVADATFSYLRVTMRIRRLARNAAFIAVAAMVMGGFLTGMAGATSAAPASTVSVVAPGGTIPQMPASCNHNEFCTYSWSPAGGLHLLQKFGCQTGVSHGAVHGNMIFEMVNLCSHRVLWYNPAEHCINPDHTSAGAGRFGNVTGFYTSPIMSC